MYDWILRQLSRLHPANLLLLSYLAAITLGAGILMLPAATVSGHIAPIDALFTSASAVCVTGLIVVDTGNYFSPFGHGVLLVLIQIGGLGIMTISVTLFQIIGKKVFFQHRMAMQEVFSHTPREDIYALLRSIFLFTAVAELAGVAILFFHWWGAHPAPDALKLALFHSVSAFCNAGFSLFETSFVNESASWVLNGTVGGLIVFGGLGFPVVYELWRRLTHRSNRPRFSVQTKTVLLTSGVLVGTGAIIFYIAESGRLQPYDLPHRMLIAIFQSITCRTAGFNTIDIGSLNSATLTLMMFLMFFGASPGSCGGGLKTTTLAVLTGFSWSRIKRYSRVNLFQKSLPEDTVNRSISLIVLSIGIIAAALFAILIFDPVHGSGTLGHRQFLSYLFETVSAFGTVGLSMGATPLLNPIGKAILIAVMIIGRIGVPVFTYIIAGAEPRKGITYAEENLMIG